MMELLYTLVGAVVGGGIAAAVAWLQTRATLRHEVAMLHQQTQAAREESRESLRRSAAVDAMAALAVLDAAMPHVNFRFAFLGGGVPGYVHDRRRRAEAAIDELRRAEVASVVLLDDDIRTHWRGLRSAAIDVAHSEIRPDEDGPDAATIALGERASHLHQLLVRATGLHEPDEPD